MNLNWIIKYRMSPVSSASMHQRRGDLLRAFVKSYQESRTLDFGPKLDMSLKVFIHFVHFFIPFSYMSSSASLSRTSSWKPKWCTFVRATGSSSSGSTAACGSCWSASASLGRRHATTATPSFSAVFLRPKRLRLTWVTATLQFVADLTPSANHSLCLFAVVVDSGQRAGESHPGDQEHRDQGNNSDVCLSIVQNVWHVVWVPKTILAGGCKQRAN